MANDARTILPPPTAKPCLCGACSRLWDRADEHKRTEIAGIVDYRRQRGTLDAKLCNVCFDRLDNR